MKLAGALFRALEAGNIGAADRHLVLAVFAIAVDDPVLEVRKNLASLMCRSAKAPAEIIATLACSPEEISLPVLKYSPVLTDDDLVNLVRGGSVICQCVIAARLVVSRRLGRAIIERGSSRACTVLVKNAGSKLQNADMMRLVKRHGSNSKIASALIARGMLPAVMSRQLMSNVSHSLRRLMVEKNWASPRRARSITMGSLENGTLDLSLRVSGSDLETLVGSLMEDGQLTPTLVLRSACAGYVRFAETALALMAKLPRRRVRAVLGGRGGFGLRALYARAGMPIEAFPLFKIALGTYGELLRESDDELSPAFHRRVIERVLTRYRDISRGDADTLLRMLEVFSTDSRRIEQNKPAHDFKAAA